MLPGACKGLKVQQNRQNKAQKEANLEVIIEEGGFLGSLKGQTASKWTFSEIW